MALPFLLAFLLATAATPAATAVAMDNNGTHDSSKTATSSRVLCNGEGCEPPAQEAALPIYGYSPPAPSLPSAPPAPPSAPGSHTPPCPPVTVVCCGAGDQFPQQPNSYGPPAGGYVPYYSNNSASPVLLVPVTAAHYVMVIACIFFLWNLV